MILSVVQKSLLVKNVQDLYDNMGNNQTKNELMKVVDKCPKYKVETDGDVILFYDFDEDEVIPFETVKSFEDFIFNHY